MADIKSNPYYEFFRAMLEGQCDDSAAVFAMGKLMKEALEEAIPHSAIEVYARNER